MKKSIIQKTAHQWKFILLMVFITSAAIMLTLNQKSDQLKIQSRLHISNLEIPSTNSSTKKEHQAATKISQPLLSLIERIHAQFGSNISKPSIQINLLEKLMAYCQKQNINDCQSLSVQVLKQAFPDHANELMIKLVSLMEYHQWGQTMRQTLGVLSDSERKTILWEKRHELFGDDANLIWASELQNDQLENQVNTLNGNTRLSLSEKLGKYKNAVNDIYADKSNRNLDSFVNKFVNMDSVQEALKELTQDEQAEALAGIRSTMGLDTDAVNRWRDLDKQRNARWQAGFNYMLERSAIASGYSGQEQSNKLDQLRVQYFVEKASAIKAEENAGYYRYSRRQIIGQN